MKSFTFTGIEPSKARIASRMDDHAGLVVRRAAAVQPAVAFDRLKWAGAPLLYRAGRLHVVVGIEQHRWRSRWSLHLSVYRRVCSIDLEEAHTGDTATAQQGGHGVCGAADLGRIEIGSRHRWDPDQVLELLAGPGKAGVDGSGEIVMHGSGRLDESRESRVESPES